MYLEHFGLRELPFGITPDTQFAYYTAGHQEALNTLLLALQSGEGFIKITGEVGSGKTLLCRQFIAAIGNECKVAYLPNPQMEPRSFLHEVAEELGAGQGQVEAAHIVRRLNAQLLDFAAKGVKVVLCIDEAQSMPRLTLESLRLLSNLETEKRKLLHIVLFGQPELDEMLAAKSARQLLQRIAFHHYLRPLDKTETGDYLTHRLRVAGYRGGPLFTRNAGRLIHRCSGGTPRLVNILAHKSLLAAFGEGQAMVDVGHVRAAVRDTQGADRVPWWWLP